MKKIVSLSLLLPMMFSLEIAASCSAGKCTKRATHASSKKQPKKQTRSVLEIDQLIADLLAEEETKGEKACSSKALCAIIKIMKDILAKQTEILDAIKADSEFDNMSM